MIRPSLTEQEYDLRKQRKNTDKKVFRLLIASDFHGWLTDLKCVSILCQILKDNHFDEVCLNGDMADFPYISRHSKKLNQDFLRDYTEVKEVEYTKEQILYPLSLSTNAKIRFRLGNHDERVTKIISQTKEQLERINELRTHYKTTEYDKMMSLEDMGILYDPSDVFTYFDMFDVAHGLSLSKRAPELNISEYMSSGSTGHTHRLNSHYKTNRKKPYVWFESGCMRTVKNVEYLPTGKVADHQQGFVVINFFETNNGYRFFGNSYPIIDGACYFNNKLYE